MYNNLIEEDIMILDNEFFKIDTMFETVDKMYDIKQRELEYNYIYTESINEEYVDLYTEAEVAKDKKEQGLLGRLFTAILNFIRKIRAKILRFFGNDKKAAELEAKIKGNPKLANQTIEITNTVDAEKAIDEGTSFFGSLIDKIVKGTATEADADAAEEKNKSLLSRIAIFGGGALLAAGGAKIANDKLHITEKLGNLLKMEEDTKKKSNEVTQTNEQNVQKAQQAMNNNSQSGNEENTKAGRRIVSSFKDFITDAGKFFTGKASELKSKINGVFSDEQQTLTSQERPKNTNTQQANDGTQQTEQKNLTPDEYYKKTIKSEKQKEFFKFKDENDKMIDEIQDYLVEISRETRLNGQNIISEYDIILKGSKRAKPHIPPSMTFEKIKTYNQKLKELLDKSKKEYEDLKSKNNVEKQSETSASKEQIKNTNTQQANDKQNQKNDNKQQNQSIDYRKDFAERLLKHESIDTVPTMKTELERIIKNGKYTDEEYKRMGEIEDRLQFEMILQKVYDDRDKLNSNDQKILDTLIKKTNITANDDKELTILLNKVQDAKYNEKKRNKSNEQQPETQTDKPEETQSKTKPEDKVEEQPETSTTDTTEQKNGKNDKTKPETKSDNQDHELSSKEKIDGEIRRLLNKFSNYVYFNSPSLLTLSPMKQYVEKGFSIVSPEDQPKANFHVIDEIFDSEPETIVKVAKRILDSYSIYSKYKNPDKNKIEEAIKNQLRYNKIDYSDVDREMDGIKTTFTTLDKYAKELNELIKKRETFKESSYDLINDILTIFENSF